ncbi:MAG: LysM peptidoglycan-binding domain-containing protein, partial [bacterium]
MSLKKLFNAFNIIKILSGLILILCLAPDLLSATAPETTGTDKAPEILSGEPQKPPQNTGNNLVSIPEQAVNSDPNNISNIDQLQNQTASEPDPGSSTPPQIAPDGSTNTLTDQIQKAAPRGQTKVVKIKEYYRVKRGDTVGKIAARYHISSKKLMQLNNLKTDLIIIGRKLFIGIRDKVLEIPLVDEQEIKAEVSSFKETLLKKDNLQEDTSDQDLSKIIGEKIAQTSLKYLGFPYKYGGESLWGMDCSAFVRRVLGFFD